MTEQQTSASLSNELERFLRGFKDNLGNYKYFERINHMMALGSTSVVIDYIDFDTFTPDLAKEMTHHPDDMLEAFNSAVLTVLNEIHPDYAEEIIDRIKVRIGNYSVQRTLRDINAEVIDKLIGVWGMVVRSSEVKPLAKRIGYRCTNCQTINEAQLKGLLLKKPAKCVNCAEKELEMDPENSIFTDFQLVQTSRASGGFTCRSIATLCGSDCHGRPCRSVSSR